MTANHTPPANALLFTVYNQECALYLNKIFDGQYGLKCVYKTGSEWKWISEPTLFPKLLDTKDKTDEAYEAALDEINIAMAALFGEVTEEPESGLDRIQWLIESQTIVVDNNLVKK